MRHHNIVIKSSQISFQSINEKRLVTMVDVHFNISLGSDGVYKIIINHHFVGAWLIDQKENINDITFINPRNIITFSFYRFYDLPFSELLVSLFNCISGKKTSFTQFINRRYFFSNFNFSSINSIQDRIYNLFVFWNSGIFVNIDFEYF